MGNYNLIIIIFIVATIMLSLWWAFNTIRQIETQKNFCAMPLSSIAKLWRRANFVPEDAKDRESLYLYRDFLRKFDGNECPYPIMVKNGGVRCMTRKEFDNLCGQKKLSSVSVLISIISALVAVGSITVNILVTKTIWAGVGLALIMPAVQIALAVFIGRFLKDKNNYRDGIFMALKENSVAFLRITKPFIIADAYPLKFGKDKKPLYATVGELTPEQIEETRAFIIRQKQAETEIVLRNVDNSQEIQNISTEIVKEEIPAPVVETIPVAAAPVEETAPENAVTSNDAENSPVLDEEIPIVAETPVAPVEENSVEEVETEEKTELTAEEETDLINELLDDSFQAEIDRAVAKAAQENQTPEVIEDLAPLPIDAVAEAVPEVEAPAEDDFSLDAIGQALDAEIAKRSKKNR